MAHYSERPFSKSTVNRFATPQLHHYFLPDGESRGNLPLALTWHVEDVIKGTHLIVIADEPPVQLANDPSDLDVGWRYLFSEEIQG